MAEASSILGHEASRLKGLAADNPPHETTRIRRRGVFMGRNDSPITHRL